MNKDRIEKICRSAGMKPETRESYKDYEIFVADGFSMMPHNSYRRFGVDAEEFPAGMYATLWWISRQTDKLDTGQPLFFDIYHNPELSGTEKKRARIAAARKTAIEFLERRKKLNG